MIGREYIISSILQMRKLRFSRGLNDWLKIIEAVSSRARTSINPMSHGFSTLCNGP